MSKFAALAGGQTGTIVAGAVVVAVVVGGSAYLMRDADKSEPQTAPQTAPVTQTAMVPEAGTPEVQTPEATPEQAPEPAPETAVDQTASEKPQAEPAKEAVAAATAPESAPQAPAAQPPSFDEVRTENDGLTVIAGKAAPGSQVILLVDGAEAARVTAEANGTFAAIAMLDPSPKARLLTLSQTDGDTSLASVDQIIVAPVTKPAPEPEAKPEPEAEPVVVAAAPAPADVPRPAPEPEPETVAQPEPAPEAPVSGAAQVAVAPTAAPGATNPASEPVADDTAGTAVPDADSQTPAPEQEPPAQTATTEPQAAPAPAPEAAPAPAEVAVLKANEDGVEVISRSSAPEVMSNVAIDTISYSDAGDVQLSGRAQAAARVVRVYLNNAPVITLDVDASGRWRGNLPNVDTGVYTLRVDEVNAGGDVTSRVETPFKREDPVVLAEAKTDDTQPITAITVQTGATLWAIARDRYGDGVLYVRVFEANKDAIKNPDLIYPGQIFELPQDP